MSTTPHPPRHRSPSRAHVSRVLVLGVVALALVVGGAPAATGAHELGTRPWVVEKAAISMDIPTEMRVHDLATAKGRRALTELVRTDPDTREVVDRIGRKNVLGFASASPVATTTASGATTIDVGWQGILVWKLGSSRGLTPEGFVTQYRDQFTQESGVQVNVVEVGGEPALEMAAVNQVAPGSIDAHTNYVFVTPRGVIELSFNSQAADASSHDPWLQPIVDSVEIRR